jgi:hypothetical protein
LVWARCGKKQRQIDASYCLVAIFLNFAKVQGNQREGKELEREGKGDEENIQQQT